MFKKEKIFFLSMLLIFSGCSSSKSNSETLEITIKDMTPPVVSILKNKSEITEGDKFDLDKCYKVTDNATKDPKIEIDKNGYSNKKPGTYKITVSATDDSGNTTKGTFTVIVKEKPKPTPTPTPEENKNQQSNQNSGNNTQNSGTVNKVTPSQNNQTQSQPAVQPPASNSNSNTTQSDNSASNSDSGDDWVADDALPEYEYGGTAEYPSYEACAAAAANYESAKCSNGTLTWYVRK